eukprot:SAG11_NODE_2325_length_3521_cov_4.278995_2_plen_95_part_00
MAASKAGESSAWQRFAGSSLASLVAETATLPMDVCKTRMQVAPPGARASKRALTFMDVSTVCHRRGFTNVCTLCATTARDLRWSARLHGEDSRH